MKNRQGFLLLSLLLSTKLIAGSIDLRLENLEDEVMNLKHELDNSKYASILNSKKLHLGGYFIFQAERVNENNRPSSFSKIHFETIISGEFKEYWKYFSEFEIKAGSLLNNKHTASRSYAKQQHKEVSKLDRAWIKYDRHSSFNITSGLFFTSIGRMNREHFHPVLLATDVALVLRNELVVRTVAGIRASGLINDIISYEVYGGSNIQQDQTPFVGGGRITYSLPWLNYLNLGISYQNAQRLLVGNVDIYGIDFDVEWQWLFFKSEYFADNADGKGCYIQPGVGSGHWRFFYRYDFADINTKKLSDDDYNRQIIGVNYLMAGDKKMKFDYQIYDYKIKKDSNNKNKDYSKFIVEMSFTF